MPENEYTFFDAVPAQKAKIVDTSDIEPDETERRIFQEGLDKGNIILKNNRLYVSYMEEGKRYEVDLRNGEFYAHELSVFPDQFF